MALGGGLYGLTLFDKLTRAEVGIESGNQSDDPTTPALASNQRDRQLQDRRSSERALRGTIIRDVKWLLNTTNLESTLNLDAFPNVRTSTLNYGVLDLSGQSYAQGTLRRRANQIRSALIAFEPRFAEESLRVEGRPTRERENAVTFAIEGDITKAVDALQIKFLTDIEADTGTVLVRD